MLEAAVPGKGFSASFSSPTSTTASNSYSIQQNVPSLSSLVFTHLQWFSSCFALSTHWASLSLLANGSWTFLRDLVSVPAFEIVWAFAIGSVPSLAWFLRYTPSSASQEVDNHAFSSLLEALHTLSRSQPTSCLNPRWRRQPSRLKENMSRRHAMHAVRAKSRSELDFQWASSNSNVHDLNISLMVAV